MDPLELLLRGVAAFIVVGLLVAAVRIRFRSERERAAPTDIGLD